MHRFLQGCKPPWYLWWFQKWQCLLNEGVQQAFQEFANNYEHQAEVPEEFSPLKNVFVHYFITNLKWTPDYVAFEAWSTFSVTVNGTNQTFVPELSNSERQIPLTEWNTTSPRDIDSHLLQGVRVSTEFINSLMWYASVSKITEYHGSAKILDSQINGTISYDPPIIKVKKDNLLTVGIGHGLIQATCQPVDTLNSQEEEKILFRAEFSDLAGSGSITLSSTHDRTGIIVGLGTLNNCLTHAQ